jgi:hypothetical protein
MSDKAVRLNLNWLIFSLIPLLQLFGSLIALLFVGEYLYPHVAVDVLEWLKHLLLNMRAPIEQRFHR